MTLTAVEAAPKAELHIHLEGSLEPDMLLALAARNKVAIPYKTADELRAAYDFANLQEFLELYWAGQSVLLTERDFYDLTHAYLARAHRDNVVHVEAYLLPQGHTPRGVPFAAVLDGALAAFDDARHAFGITGGIILGLNRHATQDDALDVLRAATPYRDRILALGLEGPEKGNPPSKFTRVYDQARDWGWHLTAHAGEEGPPEYIVEALDVLKVARIDHGVRCDQSPDLVRRLADQRMPLTVCPLSNVMLKVFPALAQHNLRRLLQAGLCVTVNSDDPPYFGGYVNANYTQSATALGLTEIEQQQLVRNGFVAAFIDDDLRARYLRDLDAAWPQGKA
ncbi:adenosine deaminase [Reyranella sp. CPCC 100927]|uniref:adenosine deaminase n=1 Tax=Reyranella sp. CPCC 100927 TaxID=2599616 RepID=UPI0011B496B4|nr:adenosine deaminase [Reyranella sp. CPCC 100927]TWT02688.1 adenosine deaminase [Reyranella sp. CPCC 100927]